MLSIPADDHTDARDLLLADGSIIYRNAFGEWFRAKPEGGEVFVGERREIVKPDPNAPRYKFGSYAAYCDAHGFAAN